MGIVETAYVIPLFMCVIVAVITLGKRETHRINQLLQEQSQRLSEQTFSIEERRAANWPINTTNNPLSGSIEEEAAPYVPRGSLAWPARPLMALAAYRSLTISPLTLGRPNAIESFVEHSFLDPHDATADAVNSIALRSAAAQMALCVAEHCTHYPTQVCPLTGLAGTALRRALGEAGKSSTPCPNTERILTTTRTKTIHLFALKGGQALISEKKAQLKLLSKYP